MSTDRKHSSVVKNVAKVGLAAAIVGVPAFVAAPSAGATNWDSVAQCESGGNWNTNTGNGFSGGLQFTPSTWKANGGSGSPQNASKSEQVHVAENVKQSQGMSAWPNCGSKGGGGSSSSGSTGSNASVHHSGSSAVHSSSPSSNTSSSQGPSSQGTSSSQGSSSQGSSSHGPSSVGSTSIHHSASNGVTGNGTTSNSVTKGHGNYTVVSGDTLGKIAKKQGNGDWQKLYQKNKDTLQSPNTLFPGQKLQTS